MPLSGIYTATKHALEALSDSLRVEVAPFGIHVIIIEPGPVKTEFFRVAETAAAAVSDPSGPYAVAFEKVEALEASIGGIAWPVEKVAHVILKAMTSPRPSARYTAFRFGNLALGLMRLTPTRIMDGMWARTFGFDQIKP